VLTSLLSLVERYLPLSPDRLIDQNALTIHYTRNTGDIGPDDMVLVDAGGVCIYLKALLTYLSFTVGISLISLVLGPFHGNSQNLRGICIRYLYLRNGA
jgi:hypothetical protein